MQDSVTGFLVSRFDTGFGDIHPLATDMPYTLGRANDNSLILKDDLCSRNHAELSWQDGQWLIQDLSSLNGVSVNGEKIKSQTALQPLDEIILGRSVFLFVTNIDQLADVSPTSSGAIKDLEIVRRLERSQFLSPNQSTTLSPEEALPPADRLDHKDALAILYKLAVEMAEVDHPRHLAQMTLQALMRATPAEVGAILSVEQGSEPATLAYLTRFPGKPTYHKVSRFVTQEVLSSGEAVLAENVSKDSILRGRDSVTELRVASLIAAPIRSNGSSLGVLHLFSTALDKSLNPNDLEFALAAAHQLGIVWANVRVRSGLTVEIKALKDQLRVESELIGTSRAIQAIEEQIGRVSSSRATVLIRGESGVGKELVARAIHFNSPRRAGPFVCLNCAAVPETLLERELFGHEKGAFTGATDRTVGKFEAASGGTLFLDEIGEMPLSTQAKLLRILEGQPFERLGGTSSIVADVRVVAATNRPLERAVQAGEFRKDLYYRLQVVEIEVPPLRERADDVPALAKHFLTRFSREVGRKVSGFTAEAMNKLKKHNWPGNVRELRNAIERAVVLGSADKIDENDVWLSPLELTGSERDPATFSPRSLAEVEAESIELTLDYTGWNKSQTASILGIERSTLDRKIKQYGIQKAD